MSCSRTQRIDAGYARTRNPRRGYLYYRAIVPLPPPPQSINQLIFDSKSCQYSFFHYRTGTMQIWPYEIKDKETRLTVFFSEFLAIMHWQKGTCPPPPPPTHTHIRKFAVVYFNEG